MATIDKAPAARFKAKLALHAHGRLTKLRPIDALGVVFVQTGPLARSRNVGQL
jgi:hypothetical protein